MKFKSEAEREQWIQLKHDNPYLCSIVYYADLVARKKFGKHLTVTSIWRDDGTIHQASESVDCRLRYDDPEELTLGQWSFIAPKVNEKYDFGGVRHDDADTGVCHIRLAENGHHKKQSNDHCHMQARRG